MLKSLILYPIIYVSMLAQLVTFVSINIKVTTTSTNSSKNPIYLVLGYGGKTRGKSGMAVYQGFLLSMLFEL